MIMAHLSSRLLCKRSAQMENVILAVSAAQFRAQANDAALFLADPLQDQVRAACDLWTTDAAQAVAAWTPLAEAGSLWSMISLGNAYRDGRGAPRDDAKAEFWFRRAFEAGSDAGIIFLGSLYAARGRYTEAREVLAVGVARDLAEAQWRMALILLRKPASAENLAEARRLLKSAAAQGYLSAMRTSATIHLRGRFGLRGCREGLRLVRGLTRAVSAEERRRRKAGVKSGDGDAIDVLNAAA
jgi:TPR repeat protein